MYGLLRFEELPKVAIATGESSTLYCTAHECQGQIATCYCVRCEVMFCTQHQQVYYTSTTVSPNVQYSIVLCIVK